MWCRCGVGIWRYLGRCVLAHSDLLCEASAFILALWRTPLHADLTYWTKRSCWSSSVEITRRRTARQAMRWWAIRTASASGRSMTARSWETQSNHRRLADRPALIRGASQIWRKVFLQPIYDKLGREKSGALITWHGLTGCDSQVISMEREKRVCHFHESKPHHFHSTSWSWPRRRTGRISATWLWRVSSFSFLSRWIRHWGSKDARVFFSSNSEMN